MRTIALSEIHGESLERIRLSFPDAELVHLTLDRIEREAMRRRLSALAVDPLACSSSTDRLAVLKARHPELAVVGVVARGADVAAELLRLSRANLDQICVTDSEDDPEGFRVAFKTAACSTVADVLRRSCRRPVPVFASQSFIHAIASIAEIRTRRAFAKTLGVTETRLQDDLQAAGLLWRTTCAQLRALMASRLLGDADEPLKRIAHLVGYRSMVALEKGLRVQLGMTASEIRSGGGLWAVGALLRRQPKPGGDAAPS